MKLAVIPARGNSTRIPRKNIRMFAGRPIIAYSIEAARESRLFDEIIVSTDHEDIVAVAKAYRAKVHMRPARLCVDNVGTQEVAKCALNWWNVVRPTKPAKQACVIYATCPMLTAEDLKNGQNHMIRMAMPYVWIDGMYYWGHAEAFLQGKPLTSGLRIESDPYRHIDVNTMDDWLKVEQLYSMLQEEKKRERARV